jgi:hypothetical protein
MGLRDEESSRDEDNSKDEDSSRDKDRWRRLKMWEKQPVRQKGGSERLAFIIHMQVNSGRIFVWGIVRDVDVIADEKKS